MDIYHSDSARQYIGYAFYNQLDYVFRIFTNQGKILILCCFLYYVIKLLDESECFFVLKSLVLKYLIGNEL